MPLVRVQVRNEYGLGQPELYGEVDREDPKALLEGVAVAGLVGILRQLGDLAEFAAEIFHGLQEQVVETASRSRKLMVRVQDVEAALPSIENAVLAQTSHIHFAYTAGCEWHPRLRNEQNHLISHDLPCFIMDSYEECRDPPRLHLLDKFDGGGPGSCLKRYSDPTFFKRSSASFDKAYPSKVQRNKKTHKTRRKRSLYQNGKVAPGGVSLSNLSGRMQFSSVINGQASPRQTASTVDMTGRKVSDDDLNSNCSKGESMYVELLHLNSERPDDEVKDSVESPSLMPLECDYARDSVSTDEQIRIKDDECPEKTMQEDVVIDTSCVVWDEKAQVLERKTADIYSGENSEMFFAESNLNVHEREAYNPQNDCETNVVFGNLKIHQLPSNRNHIDEAESEPDSYVDALNTIESEYENDFDFMTKREVGPSPSNGCYEAVDQAHDVNALGSECHASKLDSYPESCVTSDKEIIFHLPEEISAEHYTEQNLENLGNFSSANCSQGADFKTNSDTVDNAKLRSATLNDAKMCGSDDPLEDNLTGRFLEPGELSVELSSSNSAKFWTNGTLFGLQPAKPPDCTASNVVRQPLNEPSELALPVTPIDRPTSIPDHQKNDESSSQLFGIGNDFFVSGFRRMNLAHGENVEHLSSVKAAVLEQRGRNQRANIYQTLPEMSLDAHLELDFPVDSLPSSPRLEHMKISFHPINGFETTQLKLKFPYEIQSYESFGTTFPSFQLVPEQTNCIDENYIDSDYDTFCRSSPYMSDDCLSHHSESSSKQWESREYPQSKDLDLCDSLGGVSPMESIPSFMDLGGIINNGVCVDAGIKSAHTTNCMEVSYTGPPLHHPSFNTMREEKYDSSSINQEPTSLLPPLPPAQWRLTKTLSDLTENRKDVYKNLNPTPGSKMFGSTVLWPDVQVPDKEENTIEASAVEPLYKQVKLNLNGENKANQRGEGKGKEESESFLQQIRSKSFSLRRTVSDKSTNTSPHVPNVKVTAILEKASAIRQAVGSDYGDEDETWSDS